MKLKRLIAVLLTVFSIYSAFWFMTKNGEIRPDETLESAYRLNKNYQNAQRILNK